jgi:hypothetical protein
MRLGLRKEVGSSVKQSAEDYMDDCKSGETDLLHSDKNGYIHTMQGTLGSCRDP